MPGSGALREDRRRSLAAADLMTENIHLMKLVHELKAAFPAVADDVVKKIVLNVRPSCAGRAQCLTILQNEDYDRCVQLLGQASLAANGSYNRRLARGGKRRASTAEVRLSPPPARSIRRRCSDLGVTKRTWLSSSSSEEEATTNPSAPRVPPTVVLTGESPARDGCEVRTLFHPGLVDNRGEDNGDLLILGRSGHLTSFELDVDEDILNNNNSSSSNNNNNNNVVDNRSETSSSSSSCSLSSTTVSKGELAVLAPPSSLDEPLNVVATSAFTSTAKDDVTFSEAPFGHTTITQSTSTNATIFWNDKQKVVADNKNHHNSNLCPENPFKKVFARRKEFYQSLADKEAKVSSVNRLLLRKRHCAICCRENLMCSRQNKCQSRETGAEANFEAPAGSKLTLDADIQPFGPFTITHDPDGSGWPELTLKSSGSSAADLVRVYGCGEDADEEARYAASAINSEDGVESHLEVSLGGRTSVITTRHKRLGSPSEVSSNSVLHVEKAVGGGSVFRIQQQQLRRRLVAPEEGFLAIKPPLFSLMMAAADGKQRPSSAYCTGANGQQPAPVVPFFVEPRYNSLPDLFGGRRPSLEQDWPPEEYNGGFLVHPADEEKRMAFTRGAQPLSVPKRGD